MTIEELRAAFGVDWLDWGMQVSIVQACPEASVVAANAIAEAAGYGNVNMSVEIRDGQGGVWWACRATGDTDYLKLVVELPQSLDAAGQAAMQSVITDVMPVQSVQGHLEDFMQRGGYAMAPDPSQ